jgi:hypothetical protein
MRDQLPVTKREQMRAFEALGWGPTQLADLTNGAWLPYRRWSDNPLPGCFWKGGARLYFGGGGLLIVLGIIALVLGWTLVGIILIVLGLLGGGFGFYSSRRAP